MKVFVSSVAFIVRIAALPQLGPGSAALRAADRVEIPHHWAQHARRWGRSLATCLLSLAMTVSLPILAASPGLPFTEDFATTDLRDAARTNANWSTEEQAVYLAWSARRQVPQFGDAVVLAATDVDIRSIALGDVDGDGDLDVVEGRPARTNRLFLNDGSGGFSAPIDVGSETETTFKVLLGDVDRDGDLDLIVGNGGANRLYLNNGSGGFPASGTAIGSETDGTASLVLGDVDRDGDLDLIAGNSSSTNKLYLNNGSGGFSSSGTAIGSAAETRDVVLGDVDADGDLDLIFGNNQANGQQNVLFLNDGNGAFPGSGITVGTTPRSTTGLALGDVDGDGDLDLVESTTDSGSALLLYRNDGSGGFPSTATHLSSQTTGTFGVAMADVDTDGDLDLVTPAANGGVSRVLLNDGDGGFTLSSTLPGAVGAANSRAVAIGDLDGDGDMDLAFADDAGSRVFLNVGGSGFTSVGEELPNDELRSSRGVVVGDIDDDGDLDLLDNNGVVIRRYLNDGDGRFVGDDVELNAGERADGMALGDLDSDGDLDLVIGNRGVTFNAGATNRRYMNDGAGMFSAPTAVGSELDRTRAVVLGDVDADGDLDVIAGNDGQTNKLYLNDGLGNFPVTGTAIGSETGQTYSLALGDLDGDGDLDLVVGNSSFSGVINRRYLNDGFGVFSSSGANVGNENDETWSVALGDLDSDGDLDVVSGNAGQTNKLYLNDGSGNFPAAGVAIGSETGDTTSITLGDVDGDGDLDLISGNSILQSTLHLNNGNGTFPSTGILLEVFLNEFATALDDLDRDGDLDLVLAGEGETDKVYKNGSRGQFRPSTVFDTDANTTQSVAVGDVDRDGDLDVIAGNNGQTNKLYLNDNGSFPLTGTAVGSETDATTSVALGDVNGDGALDLIVGNAGQTNKRYLNDGSGGFSATGSAIGSETDTTRSVALGDLNQDGALDLVVVNGSSQTNKLYLNNGSGGFPASGTAFGSSDTGNTQSVALGDVDRDGDLDIVVGKVAGATKRLYLNNGSGGFPASGTSIGSETNATLGIVLGDLDRDGDLDVVAGNDGSSNKVYFNDGSGSYSATGTAVEAVNDFTSSVALADLDRDGDLDLIVGNAGQRNRRYLNDGTGSFTGSGIDLGTETDLTRAVALADFDRDGDFDLLVGNAGANKLHRFSSFTTTGVATSTTVNTGESMRSVSFAATQMVNTAGTRNTDIDYYLSNNGGANWYRAYPGEDLLFPSSGTDLRWKAEFSSGSPAITPMLTQITLSLVPTVAEAPTIGTATAGNATATVAFTAPANNGSAITGYTATSNPDGITSSGCTDSPCTVNGLTNGTAYTFTVTATNGIGTGPASAPSNAVTPKAPQVITFDPLFDRILGDPPFVVSATGGGSGNPVTFISLTTSVCTSSGTNGSTVTMIALGTCTIRARQAGNAQFEAAPNVNRSFQVNPETASVPDAPTIGTAVAGDTTATVSFTAPADNGSAITGYTATSNPDGITSSGCTATPCTVSGLTNGTAYTFTVTATNGVGVGPASAASNSVTPRAPQSIVFAPLPNQLLGDAPFVVAATGGGSGNPVTFASQTTSVCTTGGSNGSTVTLLTLGTCTIRASQAGSAAFNPAEDVDQSFEVRDPFLFADGFESDT